MIGRDLIFALVGDGAGQHRFLVLYLIFFQTAKCILLVRANIVYFRLGWPFFNIQMTTHITNQTKPFFLFQIKIAVFSTLSVQ